ncbi:MAG: aldehyde dehydrogenase family protein, partial [Roseinatronobacter sp.]|nr:aldehyde dehydrogenase family protein [Roseinatronobacter sp.]
MHLWYSPREILIGGQWSLTPDALPVENPSTGAQMGEIARGGRAEIDAAVQAARAALRRAWGATTAQERRRIMAPIGHMVPAPADNIAGIEG